jgi:inner membrane transporter RhtA
LKRGAAAADVDRRGVGLACALVACGSVGVQGSAAISAGLFATVGVTGASAMRFVLGALPMLLVCRPKLRGMTRARAFNVVAYGLAMAGMNLCLYAAVSRLPLGVCVTLEFLGPCAVAVGLSRRRLDVWCALAALAGVVLIAGPGGEFDPLGYLAGLGAGAGFAAYTVLAGRVGKSATGMGDLALSVTVGALVLAPLLPRDADAWRWPVIGLMALAGLLGIVAPFTVDTLAARVSSSRVVGTLFSIDPVMGLLVGWLALGQRPTPAALAGVGLVVAAGALLAWSAPPAQRDS